MQHPPSSSSLPPSSSTFSSSGKESNLQQIIANFQRAGQRELTGHHKEVHTVAWNCTGKKLASGSVDQTVRIWTFGNTGRDMELKGHGGSVHQLVWDPTHPEHLATASADKAVKIWDTRTARCTNTIKTSGANINIAWSPNGQYIAVGNKADLLTLIDARKGTVYKTWKFTWEINEIAWNKETDLLLLTTGRGGVEIMRWPSMEREPTLHAHTANCYCMKFSPNGQYFAVGGADALVSLWDAREMACVRTFNRLQWPIRTVGFSHDNRFLASASEDLVIDIADVESGDMVYQLKCNGAINTMAWHPRDHWIAFAEAEKDKHARDVGNITLWGLSSAQPMHLEN